MSVVLSKIKHYSEANNIPVHYVTRTISGLIFSIYFYKVAYPHISKYLQNKKKRVINYEGLNEFGPKEVGLLTRATIKGLKQFQITTGTNVTFLIQLIRIIRIMVPRLKSVEVLLLFLHTMSLVSRTFLSIYVANLEGQVVKYIVRRDTRNFIYMLSKWLLIALPATFVNSSIRFLENQLALAFATRLVKYGYELYFKNQTYYSVSNLDSRLENPDHYLTDDIINFSQHCARLYSSVTKPLLDLVIITYTLYKMARERGARGSIGPLASAFVILTTHGILRIISPKFGSLVAEEAQRKGYLRYVHSRIITNAEEIAFYGGHNVELENVKKAYKSLSQQKDVISNKKLWYIMVEQFLMKYVWSAMGMITIAIPVMTGAQSIAISKNDAKEDISERTQYMTTAKNILIAGGDAAERLMSSYKELIELTGYTKRVALMFSVFEQVNARKFRKQLTNVANKKNFDSVKLDFNEHGMPKINGTVIEVPDRIKLENVPIITPNCDVVVASLTFEMTRDMHLLITGPNGCGKSSLFRILAGLWPLFNGKIERPPKKEILYIPQRPYMSLGTLRDQVIYPDSIEDMKEKNITDSDLENILEKINLSHIIEREGGWDAKGDWKDILSGGEKQRMALGRLFYHRPKFALLDECTSAVSIDVENNIYQLMKDIGISLITISHRPSLWKFHTHVLRFDNDGNYCLDSLNKLNESIKPF